VPIKFKCYCGQFVEVAEEQAGNPVICPFCGLKLIIPVEPHKAPFQTEAESPKASQAPKTPAKTEPPRWQWRVALAVGVLLILAALVSLWFTYTESLSPTRSTPPPSSAKSPGKPSDDKKGTSARAPAKPGPSSRVQPTTKTPSSSPQTTPPRMKPEVSEPREKPPAQSAPVPPAAEESNPPVTPSTTPPVPPPKEYGVRSFNVITGAVGTHYDLEGYASTKDEAFREGAVLIVGVPEGVLLKDTRFEFRQIVVMDREEKRIRFRLATPADILRLKEPLVILGTRYEPGLFTVPDGAMVEDHRPK
jgi:hypothetical protein